MLGQIKIEFIFAVVVFTVIIFFIITQTNVLFSSLITDSKSDILKAKATNVIKLLAEDPGDGPNWDLSETPVDVVLIYDISASMDGKYNVAPNWGEYCRIQCNTFPNGGSPASNGCGYFSWESGVDWDGVPPGLNETWPYCADCDGDGDRSDVNESSCPLFSEKNASKVFVDQLNETFGDRSAIVTFSGSASLRLGLTSNKNIVKNAIDNFHSPDGDTEIGYGIDNATNELVVNGGSSSHWVEILLTDGQDSVFDSHPVDRAKYAHDNYGITVYTIGYGIWGYFDENQLKEIASVADGKYYYSPDQNALINIYLEISNRIRTKLRRVGLQTTEDAPFKLSKRKVNKLNQNCNYLDIFDLKNYRLKVYNSTQQILSCGLKTSEPGAVTETRYVFIDNGYGKLVLELW